ncbi:MAG: nickel pincer cofactor biosynthesis protein LarB [Chitinispirillaceae bacterium]
MDKNRLDEILESLYNRTFDPKQASELLRNLPFEDLGFAKVDHHRALRKGFPEVIFCQSKTPGQVVSIVQSQIDHDETVFGTRADPEVLRAVGEKFPETEIDESSRCFWKKSSFWKKKERVRGRVLVVSAGTSDCSVASEAKVTLEILGHPCKMIGDVGVAGIHRLFAHKELLEDASVIIVVAGMEGALPSVVAGLVSCPVIGVPTSVGYGSHLNGLVPLFAMLNSCSSGLTVVNIDNGFGAGCAAAAMNSLE